MNIAHAGAAGLLAAAVLAAVAFDLGPRLETTMLDTTTTASLAPAAAPQDSFRLVSTSGGVGCSLAAGDATEDGLRPLRLAAGCAADNPALAQARYWLDRPDGTVAFSGADGRILAEFAAADGAAFESYHPPLPIMTLIAED